MAQDMTMPAFSLKVGSDARADELLAECMHHAKARDQITNKGPRAVKRVGFKRPNHCRSCPAFI